VVETLLDYEEICESVVLGVFQAQTDHDGG
jgi:hypothetical protein